MSELDGSSLKLLRKLCGLSGKEIGDLLGVTRQTVYNWEEEKVNIPKVTKVGILTMISVKYPKKFMLWKSVINFDAWNDYLKD